jgi:uncharacterized protein YndB with AHSA1/START domain
MASCEASVTISRPPAEVFAFCADPHNDPSWQSNLLRHEALGDGPFEAGASWTEIRRLAGRQTRVEVTVTGYAPPRVLEFTARTGGLWADGRIEFDPLGQGTCVRQHMQFRGRGVSALLAPLVAHQTARELRTNLDLLQRALAPARPDTTRPHPGTQLGWQTAAPAEGVDPC